MVRLSEKRGPFREAPHNVPAAFGHQEGPLAVQLTWFARGHETNQVRLCSCEISNFLQKCLHMFDRYCHRYLQINHIYSYIVHICPYYIYIYYIYIYRHIYIYIYQRKFSLKTSKLWTIVMARILTVMATTSSCHHVNHIITPWKHSRTRLPWSPK